MKALILLRDTSGDTIKNTYIAAVANDVNDVWHAMKQVVNDASQPLSYDAFIKELMANNKRMHYICKTKYDLYDYYIRVVWHMSYATYDVWEHAEDGFANCYSRKLMIHNEGNCVDRFLSCAVRPKAADIYSLMQSIEDRIVDRANATQYHQTACYEKDFGDIIKIRDAAQKIVEYCDKHLERISEFYTR